MPNACNCPAPASGVAGVVMSSPAGSDDTKIFGFFIDQKNVLALTTVPAEYTSEDKTTYSANRFVTDLATDSSVVGYLNNPSSLAVVPLGGLTAVYGVVKTTPCQTGGSISLLSPVTMPLGVQCDTQVGSIAASSDPKHDIARIYYRKPRSGTDSAPEQKISEFSLAGPSAPFNFQVVYDGNDIDDKTYLAAYYDSNHQERHVLYQDTEAQIKDVNLETGDRYDLDKALPGMDSAGLTAIYVPDNDKTYCYYVCQGKSHHEATYLLYKATGDWDDLENKWKWSAGRKVTPITHVDKNTQLSVTSKSDMRENYIVFTDQNNVIACKHDSW
ncbi:hypothetical protein B0H63DRAFT_445414 [Podospora didyma]|uniref:Fucose-specific lectin n=1 Tax=Podospora didyma TaxID=330526 RepID=A0AAE0NWY6_9PEZI|nr:hypothetical protein B0H63DRAFT_445414 [Podospora didyma]